MKSIIRIVVVAGGLFMIERGNAELVYFLMAISVVFWLADIADDIQLSTKRLEVANELLHQIAENSATVETSR